MLSHRLYGNPLQTLIAKETVKEFRRLHTRAVSNSVKLLLPALHSAVAAYQEDKEKMKVYGEQWFREGLSYIFAVFEHCAEKKRQIGFHVTHRQIIDLHSIMLSGENEEATHLWMSLRLQYPMVPFELETLALGPQAINKMVLIAEELSASQESVQGHIILLQVMLEIAHALVHKYTGKATPPELDLSTPNFLKFVERALVKLKRLSFSQGCTSSVTSRLLRIVDKLQGTITSNPTPTLNKLQPMLRDIRTIVTDSACPSQSICSDSDLKRAVHNPIPESMPDLNTHLLHTTRTKHTTSSSQTISVVSIDPTNVFGNESASSSPKPDSISLIASASESHSVIYHTPESEMSTLPDSPITDLESIVIEPPSEPSSPTSLDLALHSETGHLSPIDPVPLLESSTLAGPSDELYETTESERSGYEPRASPYTRCDPRPIEESTGSATRLPRLPLPDILPIDLVSDDILYRVNAVRRPQRRVRMFDEHSQEV
ncbi:hypothetical protein EIP86_005031 [Pleurotus ostreatoroseus]|nr:hypothetical protein EIP86_005031 [Pleurotus ostreatoroseus]